jgi:hypothetical protein
MIINLSNILCLLSLGQENQNCTLLGRWASGPCYCAEANADTVYFTKGGYLEIVDLTEPANPVLLSETLISGEIRGMDMRSDLVFLANGDEGLTIVDVSTVSDPEILVKLPLNIGKVAFVRIRLCIRCGCKR